MTVEHTDPKIVQNDWATSPDNPAYQHEQIVVELGLRSPAGRTSIPNDIRRLIHEETREESKLNAWLHAMGISRIDHELALIELARKAVERANAS